MIEITDLLIILAGYLLGVLIGFLYGLKKGKERFWNMPSASWRVRK